MNPRLNKKDFEDLTTNLKDLAFAYLEKYSPSKQQLKVYLLKKYLTKRLLHGSISRARGGEGNNPSDRAEYEMINWFLLQPCKASFL